MSRLCRKFRVLSRVQRCSRIHWGNKGPPRPFASSPFWTPARTERNARPKTKERERRRERKKESERERSSRRRRSAPFDLACNPVGPRGLTDVMRGVRGPYVTRRYRPCVRCVRCTRLWICPHGSIGIPRRRGEVEGDVNLADLMNDETGLLWRHQIPTRRRWWGVPFWIMPR